MAGITRFWSGYPINVSANGDPGTLGGGQRADYLGGQIYPNNPNRFNFFNPLVFGRPAQGTLGNLGRNALTGPGINNWDISMYKNTRISERVSTQLRVETFNTFNHSQFFGPSSVNGDFDSGLFGQVVKAAPPRLMQLAAKFTF